MQVKVVVQHDKYAQPQATFVFASGARSETPLENLQPRQVEELLQLHRDSSGPNHFLKHGGPKVWTERRSIQVSRRFPELSILAAFGVGKKRIRWIGHEI